MKILYPLSVIYIGLSLVGCATTDQTGSCKPMVAAPIKSPDCFCKKNPLKVSFYTTGHPSMPYKVIGVEHISEYNMGGNKRQEANIQDGMRELAAAMGGDAVINIKKDSKIITGTVVAFQKENTKIQG